MSEKSCEMSSVVKDREDRQGEIDSMPAYYRRWQKAQEEIEALKTRVRELEKENETLSKVGDGIFKHPTVSSAGFRIGGPSCKHGRPPEMRCIDCGEDEKCGG